MSHTYRIQGHLSIASRAHSDAGAHIAPCTSSSEHAIHFMPCVENRGAYAPAFEGNSNHVDHHRSVLKHSVAPNQPTITRTSVYNMFNIARESFKRRRLCHDADGRNFHGVVYFTKAFAFRFISCDVHFAVAERRARRESY